MCTTRHLPAAVIAEALGVSKPTVHRRAVAEQWPAIPCGNRYEYQPPADVLALVEMARAADAGSEAIEALRVKYSDLTHSEEQRAQVLAKEKAVLRAAELARSHGRETALQLVCTEFAETLKCISPTSLREWEKRYALHGLDGLVQQKKGVVGQTGRDIGRLIPQEMIDEAAAYAAEHGLYDTPNYAKGYRDILLDSLDLPHEAREALNGDTASKSHVPRSILNRMRVSPLAMARLQGKRAGKLATPYTPRDWSKIDYGYAVTGDDMTANGFAWCPAPGPRGFYFGQPQVLAMLDCSTDRFLGGRAIARHSGQYTRDDVWGVIGDVLDDHGAPEVFYFEGGKLWRSNLVRGDKPLFTDEERTGGLKALGIELKHSRLPRSKPIEGRFHALQMEMDAFPGYAGRNQRVDGPEAVQKLIKAVRDGKLHPRGYFPTMDEFREHLAGCFERLNAERMDGDIHRGLSPNELVEQKPNAFRAVPLDQQWLYRTAYKQVKVRQDGQLAIFIRSGSEKVTHLYRNPEVLLPLAGLTVRVYWSEQNPEADAIVMSADPRKREFLGAVQYRGPMDAFGATDEEMTDETQQKAAYNAFAHAQIVRMRPYLQRNPKRVLTPAADPVTARLGAEMQAAIERTERATARRQEQTTAMRAHGPAAAADILGGSDESPEPTTAPDRQHAPDLLAELS